MKKLALNLIFLFLAIGFIQAQKTINYPSINPLIKISLDLKKWIYESEEDILILSPKNEDSGNYFCMIWTTEDPYAEESVSELPEEAIALVETLLENITWSEDISEFENNNIYFVGMDAKGDFPSDDNTSIKFSSSVIILLTDEGAALTFVFFGASNLYDKYEEDLISLLLSIKTF
ncbi:MAG: hypothetical protein GX793_01450 [Bacteroidales bacterium]|jgi:hypothetical protein|nr:hypothetical protein [Bacteroidales bacterium]MCK9498857.1 hypothetical protein [Bacteroidales bacterium]MDY0315640.1 hypothetical protein [Bacteroidales bacterium]NLB85704.1 hypothetical protein [Bacteroidales bacterium]